MQDKTQPTEPIADLLIRTHKPEVESILNHFSKGLEELISFGTHVLNWELDELTEGIDDVAIAMMLRNILEMLESISISVKNSSIDPCNFFLRGILEATFGLEYILEANTKDRSLDFMVWSYHKEIKNLKLLDLNDESHKKLQKELNGNKKDEDQEYKLPIILGIDKEIKRLEEDLSTPKFLAAENRYQYRCKKRKEEKKKGELKWYNISEEKCSTLEQLAIHLNKKAHYEILYRKWSNSIHVTDIIKRKLYSDSDGKVYLTAIRFPNQAQEVTLDAWNLGNKTLDIITHKRMPSHRADYIDWRVKVMDFINQLRAEELINYNYPKV